MKFARLLGFVVLTLSLVGTASPGFCEVSVVPTSRHDIYSLALLSGGGSDAPEPWPTVREHLPPEYVLNSDGGDNLPPDGPPTAIFNPDSQTFEVVWAQHDGNDYEIVISRWEGDHWSAIAQLTDNATDDLDPDMVVAEGNETRISFWTPSGIQMMTRTSGSSTWGLPQPVNVGAMPSAGAAIQQEIAYQQTNLITGDSSIVYGWNDGSWNSSTLVTTTFTGIAGTGDLDVRIHVECGHTWIVWESAMDSLSWCEVTNNSCAPIQSETISGADDEERGRFRIEKQVLLN